MIQTKMLVMLRVVGRPLHPRIKIFTLMHILRLCLNRFFTLGKVDVTMC